MQSETLSAETDEVDEELSECGDAPDDGWREDDVDVGGDGGGIERCIMHYCTYDLIQCSWRGCKQCNAPAKDVREEIDFEAESVLGAAGWVSEDRDRRRGRPTKLDISFCDGRGEVTVRRYDRRDDEFGAERVLWRSVVSHDWGWWVSGSGRTGE